MELVHTQKENTQTASNALPCSVAMYSARMSSQADMQIDILIVQEHAARKPEQAELPDHEPQSHVTIVNATIANMHAICISRHTHG